MADPESSQSGFTKRHRFLTLANLIAGAAAVAAALVMLNYIAAGHFKRIHLNNVTSFQLSPLTLRLVRSLTNDVTITVFFNQADQGDVYTMVCGMLKEYQAANPSHIHVAQIDEDRDFGAASDLLKRLHLTGSNRRNFVAFESPALPPVTYSELELAHLDASDMSHIRRDAFNGEVFFTSYIFSVLNPQPKKAYFLTGHGERDPGDPSARTSDASGDGVAKLASILKVEDNCDWGLLSLQGTNTVPADCQLLIIASPQRQMQSYSTNELQKIHDFLRNHNGRLLALLDVDMGLNPLLVSWGVVWDPKTVEELDQRLRLGPHDFEALIHDVPNPIVAPLKDQGLTLHMYSPHPIFNTNTSANPHPGAPQIDYLVGTSPNATDGLRKGTFPLIASIEHGVINDREGTRIVVAGDADFLDDQLLDDPPGANHFFAEKVFGWLLQRPNLILRELGPRPILEYRVSMTEAQKSQARWLFLVVMPGAVLFLGGLVWLRRRS